MAVRLRRPPRWPARTLTSSAAPTRRGKRRCTWRTTPAGSRSWCAVSHWSRDVALPGARIGGRPERGGPHGYRRGRWWRRRAARVPGAPQRATGDTRDGRRRWAVRADRGPAANRLAAGRAGQGPQGFLLTGTDLHRRSRMAARAPPDRCSKRALPGVFAAGDVRHGAVKRVASAVGEGSIAIQLVHSLFAADRLEAGRPALEARRRCSRSAMFLATLPSIHPRSVGQHRQDGRLRGGP